MIRNNNPVFRRAQKADVYYSDSVATYKGVLAKTLIYLAVTVLGAFIGLAIFGAYPDAFIIGISISGIFTLIFSLIAMISPRCSKVFGMLYCLFEGAFLGFISMLFESVVSGVIVATLVATVTVILVICTLFLSGLIKVNSKFVKFLLTFAISVIVTQFVIMLVTSLLGLEVNSTYNLIASVITVFLACLFLLWDLQEIVDIVENGYPKEFEWFASFGLVFTILWLYLELLPIVFELLSDR